MKELRAHLVALGLHENAIAWLLDLWEAIQTFDDFVDEVDVEREQTYRLIWNALIGMPSNPFFLANAQVLLPVMANSYLKWRAAESAEQRREVDEKSFMWRASFYDVVLQCVLLVHGSDKAAELSPAVMALYGERLEDYKKEFSNA